MKKINVLFAHNVAKIGGAEKVTLDIISGLDNHSFSCHVLTPEQGPLLDTASAMGAQTTAMNVVQPSKKNILTFALFLRKLIKIGQAHVIDISLGDKCNAWNEYAHSYLSEADIHFFVDSDVVFTPNAFPILFNVLLNSERTAITGLPQSGRNIERYTELVVRYSCLFGNLYGLKREFLERIRERNIGLPIGLSWIDSQITKLVNEDLNDNKDDYQHWVTYVEGVGYEFSSLKPWKIDDIKLYINRIIRYQTGQLQEIYLDKLPFTQWPKTMAPINEQVLAKGISAKELGWKIVLKSKIVKRLTRKYA